MIWIKMVLFIVVSAGLALVSRPALKSREAHGFYRFFAWESILVLFLLNLDNWFHDPLSPLQIVSWVLLIISIFLVVHGVILLRSFGKPDEKREGNSLFVFEKTSHLVVRGAYRYIRHPLYSSLLFLAWGIFFKTPSWMEVVLAAAATVFLVLTAKREETENERFFGEEYKRYKQHTRLFIPFLF